MVVRVPCHCWRRCICPRSLLHTGYPVPASRLPVSRRRDTEKAVVCGLAQLDCWLRQQNSCADILPDILGHRSHGLLSAGVLGWLSGWGVCRLDNRDSSHCLTTPHSIPIQLDTWPGRGVLYFWLAGRHLVHLLRWEND